VSSKPSETVGAMLEAMRPSHWVKNVFVAAPLLFSGRFMEPIAWARCLAGVAAFCLVSSAIYLINDVHDREADAAHPTKRNRPLPSGRLGVGAALFGAAALLIAGMALSVAVDLWGGGTLGAGRLGLSFWTLIYVLMNGLYSFWLKSQMIVDVILVAFGFVVRAMAGAGAIGVPVSPWLVVCTFSLCLVIALTKRRSEIRECPPEALGAARPANAGYQADTLEHMINVATSMALLTYTLYCLAPRTVEQVAHSSHMIWTVPLVVYGVFRFNHITRTAGASDPTSVLLRDRTMWLVVAAYGIMAALILRMGPHPWLKALLD